MRSSGILGLVLRTEGEEREKVTEERERMSVRGCIGVTCTPHDGLGRFRFFYFSFFFGAQQTGLWD